MTRQEQIEQAAINYAHRQDDDFVYGESEAFIAGAMWADQNPDSSWATRLKLEKEELLDKAGDWLAANFKEIGIQWQSGGGAGYLVEQLKQAMR